MFTCSGSQECCSQLVRWTLNWNKETNIEQNIFSEFPAWVWCRFVNFGLLFWVVWDAVANGTLTIYCLTGLLFTQSGRTYQKFRAPAWLALTHSVCVCSLCMCAAPECRQCSSRMYWKELSFAPKCFLIAYIFKQTRLKNACKWYNLVTTCSGPIW